MGVSCVPQLNHEKHLSWHGTHEKYKKPYTQKERRKENDSIHIQLDDINII